MLWDVYIFALGLPLWGFKRPAVVRGEGRNNTEMKPAGATLYDKLTERQKQVLELESQGLTQAEIAERSGVTQPQVSETLNSVAVRRYREVLISGELRAKILNGWKAALNSDNEQVSLRAVIELTGYIPEQFRKFLLQAYKEDEVDVQAKPAFNAAFGALLNSLTPQERIDLLGDLNALEKRVFDLRNSKAQEAENGQDISYE